MPPKFPFRISPVIYFGFFLVVVFFVPLTGWGSAEAPVGILDDNGGFQPKLTVTTKGASIIITKTNMEDRFDSLQIRFKFPGAGEPGSMNGMFIQWEKEPEKWGKLWRLDGHRGFDNSAKQLSTRWIDSPSLLLLDRSPNRRLGNRPWDQVIELWLDGKPVIKQSAQPQRSADRPPAVSPQEAPGQIQRAPDSSGAADRRHTQPDSPAMDRATVKALEKKYRELVDRITKLEESVDGAAEKALEKKYLDLSERTAGLEHAAAVAHKWFFWGPLLALTLSILFSSVALFLTFIRQARGHSGRRNFL